MYVVTCGLSIDTLYIVVTLAGNYKRQASRGNRLTACDAVMSFSPPVNRYICMYTLYTDHR